MHSITVLVECLCLMIFVFVFVTGVCLLAYSVSGLYPSNSDVVDLTESNFDKLVTQSDNIWVVEFYAPWCGHCRQFAREFSKAATGLKVCGDTSSD